MNIFKSILILVLLIGIGFSVYGDTGIVRTDIGMSNTEIANLYWPEDKPKETETLFEWFKSRTLDERVEIYQWWKEKDCTEKNIVSYAEYLMYAGNCGKIIIEISNIKPYKIDTEKDKIKKLIGDKNVDYISFSDKKFRIMIWVDGENAIKRLRAIRDKLLENGFKFTFIP